MPSMVALYSMSSTGAYNYLTLIPRGGTVSLNVDQECLQGYQGQVCTGFRVTAIQAGEDPLSRTVYKRSNGSLIFELYNYNQKVEFKLDSYNMITISIMSL
jgi:hypothetical protein